MASGVEVRNSPIHGVGVFAIRKFNVGERVLPIDDSRIVTQDAPLDPEKGEYDHHQDYLGTHDVLMQEPERHINHCCKPNVYIETLDGVRWVSAYRDIQVGDEIAYDYCINSYGDDEWDCSCGQLRCRRTQTLTFSSCPRQNSWSTFRFWTNGSSSGGASPCSNFASESRVLPHPRSRELRRISPNPRRVCELPPVADPPASHEASRRPRARGQHERCGRELFATAFP